MQKHGMATRFPKVTLRTFLSQFGTIVKTMGANWLWVGGVVIGLAGGVTYMEALSVGDLSVIQPLINMTMVFAILMGVALLGERLAVIEWVGMAVMIAGAVVISLSGAEETSVNPPTTAAYAFFAGVAGLSVGVFYLHKVLPGQVPTEVMLSVIAGLLFGLVNICVKVLTFLAKEKLGTFNLLSPAAWRTMVFSIPSLILVVCLIVAFVLMQGAFAHGRVSLVAPITTIFGVLVPIVAGLLIFREEASSLRLTGITVTLVGTVCLALRRAKDSEVLPGGPTAAR